MRTHFFDFGSVAAVDRKLFRSADAWDEFSFAVLPREVRRAPWRRRARRQRECAVSTLGVEEKVIARAGAQGQVRRRRAFVWKRERSGHDRVCAGYAGR